MNPRTAIAAWALLLCAVLGRAPGWAAEPSPELGLTPDEVRYIKEHPVVTLGAAASFDPFIKRNEDGSYSGIDVEFTDIISEKTGLKFRFVPGKWDDIVKRAEQRELDGLTSSISHPNRAKYFNFTTPYVKYSSVVFVKKNNPKGIHCLKDLHGKRAAVMMGNINSVKEIRRLGGDIEIGWEPTLHDVIRSVALGRNDFMILGESVFYIAAELGLAGFIENAFPTDATTELCYSLRNDRPELVSIFNKALKTIPHEKMVSIRNKWIGASTWAFEDKDGGIALSPKEREYLGMDGSLGVCVRGDRPPMGFFSSKGRLEGMVADFIRLAGEDIGPGVPLLPVRSSAPLEDLAGNKCDLVMMMEEPDHPVPGVSFTTPYLSFPYVVVAAIGTPFMGEFQPDASQAYVVVENSPVIPLLRKAYPGIDLREVDSVARGLKKVRDGEMFGLVATSPAVAHGIQDKYLTELKIIGQTPFTARFAVATRASPPELNHIFQKVVGHLSDQEKRQIVNKWMAVKYEKGVDYSLVWKILAAAFVLLAVTLYWNRKLNRAKSRAEEALAAEREAIRANLNFIDMISHEYRSPLSVISSNLDLIEAKTAGDGVGDVSKEVGRMRNSTRRLLNIFENSLKKIRLESASILPDMRSIDIGHLVRAAVQDIRSAHPGHGLDLDMPEGPPLLVHADSELLNVAILNVLDNACKYSEAGKPVAVSLAQEGGRAVLTVGDQGVGIGDEDLGRVFEKYYRSRNVGKKRGVGVGLYLVDRIVKMHGGEVRVSSRLGQGTTVTLEFPTAQSK